MADVKVTGNVPTSLGGLVGVSSVKADRSAAAALGIAKKMNGVFPLAVCTLQADEIMANATTAGPPPPYPAEVIKSDKKWGDAALCAPPKKNAGSGNWGWLDCGNGVSAQDLKNYIKNGCHTSLLTLNGSPPSSIIEGAPGNKGNANGIETELKAALDQVYAFPVYTTIGDNGSGAKYTITGFIQLKICAAAGQTGTCYDSAKPVGDDDLQVRFVDYVPMGQINTLCGIGGASCPAFNSYVTSLIK
jgi:hypothetical protein